MRLALLALLASCSTGPAPAAVDPVAHLVGCWRSVGPEGDRWSVAYARPAAGLITGTTRQLRPDGTVSEEQERFEVGADGRLGVTSVLDGVSRDRFVLDPARSGPDRAVFARATDGWPEWLGYAREADTLRLELGGGDRVVTMELGATPCR
jgi:hypothetical protein